MVNYRVKLSEGLDSGILVEHIWDNFDLVMFKVISRSFDALVLFFFSDNTIFTSLFLLNL